MGAGKSKVPCAFDKLLEKNVPHIVEKIFLPLDFQSFMMCLEVSNTWRELLKTEWLRRKVKLLFQHEIPMELWNAAMYGKSEIVIKLLSTGLMNVNCAPNADLSTPLVAASGKSKRDYRCGENTTIRRG